MTLWSGFWAILSAVVGLGLSHTVLRAPLYALAAGDFGNSETRLAALRMIERVGAILGLATSALLLNDVGAEISIRALGIVVLCGVALYAIIGISFRSRSA